MRATLVSMTALAMVIAAPAAAQDNAVTAEDNGVAANVVVDPALDPALTTDPMTTTTTTTDPAMTTTMPPDDFGTFGAEPATQDRGGGFPWGLLGLIGLAGLLGRSRGSDVDTRDTRTETRAP